jgi:hypothetical protein
MCAQCHGCVASLRVVKCDGVVNETFRDPERSDWERTLIRVGALILVMTLGAAVLFGLEVPLGFLVWLAITVFLVTGLARWHTRSFGYQCPRCAETFAISNLTNAVSPNIVGRRGPRKYLRCPACRRRSWCRILLRSSGPG